MICSTVGQTNKGRLGDMSITGMNHAVLYVRSADRTATFYEEVLGFRRVIDDPGVGCVFLRAPRSANHHDLALFTIGSQAANSDAGGRTVGLYHIAWEVPTLEDLVEVRSRLAEAGAFVGASDHGPNLSLYGRDPDELEFEVMWLVPQQYWGDEEHKAIVRPLDLEREIARFASAGRDNTR